jgi:hypothetical protein
MVVLNIYDWEWTVENGTNSLPSSILFIKLMHAEVKEEIPL